MASQALRGVGLQDPDRQLERRHRRPQISASAVPFTAERGGRSPPPVSGPRRSGTAGRGPGRASGRRGRWSRRGPTRPGRGCPPPTASRIGLASGICPTAWRSVCDRLCYSPLAGTAPGRARPGRCLHRPARGPPRAARRAAARPDRYPWPRTLPQAGPRAGPTPDRPRPAGRPGPVLATSQVLQGLVDAVLQARGDGPDERQLRVLLRLRPRQRATAIGASSPTGRSRPSAAPGRRPVATPVGTSRAAIAWSVAVSRSPTAANQAAARACSTGTSSGRVLTSSRRRASANSWCSGTTRRRVDGDEQVGPLQVGQHRPGPRRADDGVAQCGHSADSRTETCSRKSLVAGSSRSSTSRVR